MSCRYEREVVRAAGQDRWSDALRAHLLECDDCVAAAAVSPWMTRFSKISDREHPLPDPQLVFLKAKLLHASADAARVARPITLVQIAAYFVVAGGWAALLTWKWDAVAAWLRGLTPTGMVQNVASGQQSLSMWFFAMVFVLASTTAMLALHTIMAEDA